MGPTPDRSRPYEFCGPEHDLGGWPPGVPPRRTIVVCASARTGSTLFAEALHQRGLPCPVEYLNPTFAAEFAERWRCRTPREYVDALWRQRTGPDGTLTVKLHGAHLDFFDRPQASSITDAGIPARGEPGDRNHRVHANLAVAFPAATFVYLSRRDKIQQAISFWLAEATGNWESRRGDPATVADQPFDACYDFAAINHKRHVCLEEAEAWEVFFASNGLDPFRLTYEALAADIPKAVNALAPGLGFTPDDSTPSLVRQAGPTNDALAERFMRDLEKVAELSATT